MPKIPLTIIPSQRTRCQPPVGVSSGIVPPMTSAAKAMELASRSRFRLKQAPRAFRPGIGWDEKPGTGRNATSWSPSSAAFLHAKATFSPGSRLLEQSPARHGFRRRRQVAARRRGEKLCKGMLYACQRTEIPGQQGYKRDSCVVDCFRHALRPLNSFNPREREIS